MTGIKICGIKSEMEVDILNKYLPDFVGFVFAESKRRVEPEKAEHLAARLDGSIKKVGVFVNASIEEIIQIVEKVGLDIIQLHGNEEKVYISHLKSKMEPAKAIWKAFKLAAANSNGSEEAFQSKDELEGLNTVLQPDSVYNQGIDKFLVDAYAKGSNGGTGLQFDWRLLEGSQFNKNIVLAGGLNPSNVCEAISIIKPYAVDVSSGVEMNGVKNEGFIKEFIRKVRGSDL
jgi:Phosphoribosylanthranilate isomerase